MKEKKISAIYSLRKMNNNGEKLIQLSWLLITFSNSWNSCKNFEKFASFFTQAYNIYGWRNTLPPFSLSSYCFVPLQRFYSFSIPRNNQRYNNYRSIDTLAQSCIESILAISKRSFFSSSFFKAIWKLRSIMNLVARTDACIPGNPHSSLPSIYCPTWTPRREIYSDG